MDQAVHPLVDQNKKLEKVVKEQNAKLAEQDDMLAKMLADPLIFGTVVGVSVVKPARELYCVGDLALVVDTENPNYRKTGRVAELPADDGYVAIKLMGEGIEYFTIGMDGTAPQVRLLGKDDGMSCLVQTKDQLYSLSNVPELHLIPGDVVKLHPKSLQIVDRSHVAPPGDICRVVAVLDNGKLEVDHNGHKKVVFPGYVTNDIEVGDRVCLDPSNVVVIHKLPPEFADQYGVEESEITVKWDDIGGCEAAKEELIEALELPFKFPDVWKHYRKGALKGALLYGPPGCGKTLLAQASANSLATIHGKSALNSGFIYVKGPELLKRWVGDSEETLRAQFVKAEKHYEEHGYPALLFIDEAEALFRKRGSGVSSDITDNMVTTFLSEMSGLNASHVMVLLATNTPKMLDSAVIRDGRCDRHIKVPRPTIETVPTIFDIYFDGIPLFGDFDREQAIAVATAEVFNRRLQIYDVAAPGTAGTLPFFLHDAVNGAMVKGIVDKATSLAMKRDMRDGTLTGVTAQELKKAVHLSYRQNRDINHDLNLIDFAERNGLDSESLEGGNGVRLVGMPAGLFDEKKSEAA